jgi:hypothetical protein
MGLENKIMEAAYTGHPFLTMLHKETHWTGQAVAVGVIPRRDSPNVTFVAQWAMEYERVILDYRASEGDKADAVIEKAQDLGQHISARLWTKGQSEIVGLDQWLPVKAPGSSSFQGVDRSVDPVRLGGIRHDARERPGLLEAVHATRALALRHGLNEEAVYFTDHESYRKLNEELGEKRDYVDFRHQALGVEFSGLRIQDEDGEFHVFHDSGCPQHLLYTLDMDHWVLGSMQNVPHLMKQLDDVSWLTQDPEKTYPDPRNPWVMIKGNGKTDAAVTAYLILACYAPGRNIVTMLPGWKG